VQKRKIKAQAKILLYHTFFKFSSSLLLSTAISWKETDKWRGQVVKKLHLTQNATEITVT